MVVKKDKFIWFTLFYKDNYNTLTIISCSLWPWTVENPSPEYNITIMTNTAMSNFLQFVQ